MLRLILTFLSLAMISTMSIAANSKIVPMFKCVSKDKDLLIETRKQIGKLTTLYQINVDNQVDDFSIVTFLGFSENEKITTFSTRFLNQGKISLTIKAENQIGKNCMSYKGIYFYQDPQIDLQGENDDLICTNLEFPARNCK